MGVHKEVKYHYSCDHVGCSNQQAGKEREEFDEAGWLAVILQRVSAPPGVANAPKRKGILCPVHAKILQFNLLAPEEPVDKL